jgi:outer membrane protein assembly factor BamB
MRKCLFAVAMGLFLLLCPLAALAAQVTMPLISGWNLVNLPLEPDAPSVQEVLVGTGVQVTSVWKWEGNTWAVFLPDEVAPGSYAQSKQFGVLSAIHAGQGLWLNCQGAGQLQVSGQPPAGEALQLNAGWNLIGLKQGAATTVAQLLAPVKTKVVSVWAWQGTTWAVSLPGEDDDGTAYALSKQFGHLVNIQPSMGFWVNALEATGPFPPAVGKVLCRINGALTPVANAGVYLNNQVIATSDQQGLFTYPIATGQIVTVKAPGLLDRTALLAASSVRSYFWLDQPQPEPEFAADAVVFDKVKAKTQFKEYPNLLIMEAHLAEAAKPTPKEVSDGTAALTITDMALTTDITVAVSTFTSAEEGKVAAAMAAMVGTGQTLHLIGGADVLISDSDANPIALEATGFGGKVRTTLKDANLSAGAMSLAAMQAAVNGGTGTITLLYYHDEAWHTAGKAVVVNTSNGGYAVCSAPGVVLEGLYPFLYIYAGKKVVTGTVVGGGKPVANALITLHGSDDSAVTLADGSFSLMVPDLLPEASLTVFHESYYLAKATATFTGAATTTAIAPVALTSLPQAAIHGQVTDQQPAGMSGAAVTVRFAKVPANIAFPQAITVTTAADGAYAFSAVPTPLLASATVEVTLASGYHTVLDQPLPALVAGSCLFDISLVAPLWVHATGGNLYAAPVVADGSVYLGGVDGIMRRLDAASGQQLWQTDTHRPIFATPALDGDHLYFGTVGNQLWALQRATGANVFAPLEVNSWPEGNTDIVASPALVDGVLSFGSNDASLYFFGTDGSALNSDYLANNITGSAAVDNNTLYFGGWDGRFYAYTASGSALQLAQQWQFPAKGADPLPARILSSPVVADGKVYFGGGNNLTVLLTDTAGKVAPYPFTTAGDHQTVVFSEEVKSWTMKVTAEDKTLYCLNAADGGLAWQFPLDGAVVGRPAIVGQTLFIATLQGTVSALDISSAPQVSSQWTFASNGAVYSSPVVANGRVYFGSEDHWLYCLDAVTGKQLWRLRTGDRIIATPVVAGGKVYAASLDGSLYCLAE